MNAPVSGAQSNIPTKLLKPLQRKRAERFVWQWPDTAWIAAAALTCILASPHSARHERGLIGLAMCILCACASYAAGLKMHSRTAGAAAAVLLATSRSFVVVCVGHPTTGALACAVICAVASYGIGWLIVAYFAACLAFTLGFNGALIGLVIATVPLVQKRDNAIAGFIGYIAFGLLWSFAVRPLHLPSSLRPWGTWHDASDMLGLAVMVLWFMTPFYAEATLKGARERWLLALALVATVTLIVFTSNTALTPQLYLAFPLAMLVVSVGLAHLMPAIAGEYPSPAKRYIAATAAVAITVALKLCLDPTLPADSPRPAAVAVYRSALVAQTPRAASVPNSTPKLSANAPRAQLNRPEPRQPTMQPINHRNVAPQVIKKH